MPAWNANNGSWGDPARWTGGVPNSAGAVADFTIANAGSANRIVSFADGATFTIGTLNIVTDADDGWIFRGQVDATSATLRFQGAGGSPAFINVDTNGSSVETTIDGLFGMRLSFASDVILTTAGSDTLFRINAPIIGAGDLYKFGDGTLILNGGNSGWTGDLNLLGGRTEISSAAAGNAVIAIDNNAVLATGTTTLANRIEAGSDDAGGTIAARTGTTLTLSGLLISMAGNGAGIRFGSAFDTGTIVLTGTSLLLGEAGFTIGGGIVRLGNASVAANYFSNLPSSALLQVVGTFDTNGHAAFVDNLDMDGGTILSGTGALNLTINDTVVLANANAGTIQGTAGADRIVINVLNNYSIGSLAFNSWTSGTDTITIIGSDNDNALSGSVRDDLIDGGMGTDSMSGGAGNDTYIVDRPADVVLETAGQGNDTVASVSNYVLAVGVEVETLMTTNAAGTASIALTGNTFAQRIVGNAGNNFLYGVGGVDILDGGAGDDVIIVDADDSVIEAVGGGNDLVASVSNYVLAAGAEVETLSTTNGGNAATIALTGNEFGQTIIGNVGNNFLNGGGGADILDGAAGDDVIIVDGNDIIIEAVGGGNDLVASMTSYTLNAGASVETLSTTFAGGGASISLTGNALAQTILGNAGFNVLDGKGGNDTLQGFGGTDFFTFTTALGAGNVDTITDFSVADDTIQLDDAIFTAIGGLGALSANAFVTGGAAADASDRIIYNSATGALLYDADGTGGTAAVQFATIGTGLALTANDFAVI